MDDRLKGIRGESLRLPFPLITIEFSVPANDKDERKVVIVARETPNAELAAHYEGEHGQKSPRLPSNGASIVCVVVAGLRDETWCPLPAGLIIPSAGWDTPNDTAALGERSPDGYGFATHTFVLMGDMYAHVVKQLGEREAENTSFQSSGKAAFALLEFLEALSCSNVRHEIAQATDPAKNARRIRDGKLPIYETRVLTVEVPRKVAAQKGSHGTGTHASPREHLRRGHIRRLPPDHTRKIWVNAAIVGAGNHGRVDKTYRIKPAA
jgi:hypothetical protein